MNNKDDNVSEVYKLMKRTLRNVSLDFTFVQNKVNDFLE